MRSKMASFKFALLLGAVVTVLQCGCTSTSGAGENWWLCHVYDSLASRWSISLTYACFLFAGEEQCTSGFLDFDSIDRNSIVTLPDSSLSNTDLLSNFRRWIFPNINFTCDGYITSWILRVNNSMESTNTALIPQITTWRFQGGNLYRQQSITNESQLTSLKIDTRLIFTPSPPIPVQAGDIVGIQLPLVNDDQLTIKPLFLKLSERNSSTTSCIGLQGQLFFFWYCKSDVREYCWGGAVFVHSTDLCQH